VIGYVAWVGVGLAIGIGVLGGLFWLFWWVPTHKIRPMIGDRRIDRAWPVAMVVLPVLAWAGGGIAAAATMAFITGLGWIMWVNHR